MEVSRPSCCDRVDTAVSLRYNQARPLRKGVLDDFRSTKSPRGVEDAGELRDRASVFVGGELSGAPPAAGNFPAPYAQLAARLWVGPNPPLSLAAVRNFGLPHQPGGTAAPAAGRVRFRAADGGSFDFHRHAGGSATRTLQARPGHGGATAQRWFERGVRSARRRGQSSLRARSADLGRDARAVHRLRRRGRPCRGSPQTFPAGTGGVRNLQRALDRRSRRNAALAGDARKALRTRSRCRPREAARAQRAAMGQRARAHRAGRAALCGRLDALYVPLLRAACVHPTKRGQRRALHLRDSIGQRGPTRPTPRSNGQRCESLPIPH